MTAPAEPTADPYAEALVTSEATAQDLVSDNLVALMMSMWASFSAFYAGAEVAAFGARIAGYVIAAQRQAGLITEAHLRQQNRRMGLEMPSTPILDLPRDLRLGAATEDVYQRPIRQVRYLESTGVPRVDALKAATERLEATALVDVALARATAAQQVMYALPDKTPQGPVRGYRRVIHPELGQVCGLCIAASDRVYRKRDMLPLHNRCKCTIIPVIGVQDPGGQLNAADLATLYAAAGGSTSSAALKRVRYEIKENGEMGPVLTEAGTRMKGPATAVDQLSDRAKQLRREQLQRQIEALRGPASRSQWHADRLEQLRELLSAA